VIFWVKDVVRVRIRRVIGRVWVVMMGLCLVLPVVVMSPACNGVVGPDLTPSPNIGYPAPDFTLVDLDGNAVRLSDFRGRVVFLNFWATRCPACRAEMPGMEEVYQEYKDEDVVIIGVDILESASTVRDFVEENGYSWTFVLDTTGEVSIEYAVIYIPSSFFIDENGIIRAINVGYMSRAVMESKLAEAMK